MPCNKTELVCSFIAILTRMVFQKVFLFKKKGEGVIGNTEAS